MTSLHTLALFLFSTAQRDGSDDVGESTTLEGDTVDKIEGGGEDDVDIVLPEYHSGDEEELKECEEMYVCV